MRALRTLTVAAFVAVCAFTSCKKDNNNNPGGNSSKILLDSEFDKSDAKWGTGTNDYSVRSFVDGFYIVQNKDAQYDYVSYTDAVFGSTTDNIGTEARVRATGGNTNYAAYSGIAYNYSTSSKAFSIFGFYNDGHFEVFDYNAAGTAVTAKYDVSSAIKANDFNTLRIELKSGTYHYLINGTEVFSRPSNGIKLDLLGVYANPATTTTVDFYKAFKL